MSEYWKSTPKYWCKQCSVYVKDTSFERKQHENTGKHQGNLRRFLRGIQNDHERNEREKERAKAEVDRLNRVVGGGPATTIGAASSSASQSSTSRKAVSAAPTAGDQQRQWAQLAEMGIQVPDSFRAEMAMPGEWQTVSKKVEDVPVEGVLSKGVRKRKLDDEDDEEQVGAGAAAGRRSWGSTTRRYPGQDGSDLDELLSGPLVKKDKSVMTESKTKSEVSDSLKAEPDTQSFKVEEEWSSSVTIGPEDKVGSDVKTHIVASTSIHNEAAETEQRTPLDDVPDVITAPVFKKRKAKSQAPTAEKRAAG